ncbi:MAG: PTS sugar transporter subunit IIA [Clostridia bacterium]
MDLKEVLDYSLCFSNLEVKDWEDGLRKLSGELYIKGIVNAGFVENVVKREMEFPTGLPMGGYNAALPHTYPEYVNHSAICIATLKNPVDFCIMGSPKEIVSVNVIFMLAIKEGSQHLDLLKQLIEGVIQDSKLINDIVYSKSGQEIFNAIIGKIGNS